MTAVDADVYRSDALANLTAHLVGPLGAGARAGAVALDPTGAGVVAADRHPLLVVVLAADLGATGLDVDVVIGSAAAVRLAFAAYSERGATLAIPFAPAVSPVPIRVTPHAGVAVRIVDGVIGRLLHVLSAEKSRLRRAAREIAAGHRVAGARGATLDRLGVELRVPRFRATIAWSAADGELVATPGDEADAAYRDRLALYRGQVRPTRTNLAAALPALMQRVGYTGELAITEPDTELAIAIRVVSPPNDARRVAHLAYVRRQFLLPATAAELPAERMVSIAERTRARDLLARLAARTTWPANAHIAPSIAAALDRVARCAAALGVAGPVQVTRAQRDDGGSRYELGVGADVTAFTPAQAQSLADALRDGDIATSADAETRLRLAAMTAEDATTDDAARWLYRGCGLRTVHAIGGGTLYVSHLPIHGATLEATGAGTVLALTAMLRAEGAAAIDANLADVIALAVVPGGGWTVAPATALAGATAPPAAALAAFATQQLRTPAVAADVTAAVTALGALPAELIAVLRADAPVAAGILANTPAGAQALAAVVGRLRAAGVVAVLPIVVGTAVFLVIAMTDLPAQAAVLNARRVELRWLAAPLEADERIGTLDSARGSRNHYVAGGTTAASQVAAVIAMTPTRPRPRDLARRVEPYTVAIDLADPGQPLLSFTQYEYLMNLLDRWSPLGITVDTTRLRHHGVDFDGDGVPDLMTQSLQHTFRSFRGRRPLGGRS
jgi:hypothetical protein